MLARVQCTGQNLLNLMAKETEGTPPEVMGCIHCNAIFDISYFVAGFDASGGVALACCPSCGYRSPKVMGKIAYTMEAEDGIYLTGDGVTTGPYPNEGEARNNMWNWFKEKEKHEREKAQGGFKVVSLRKAKHEAEGAGSEEGDAEGSEE